MQLLKDFGYFNLFILLGGLVIVILYVDRQNPSLPDILILVFYALTVALHAMRFMMLVKNKNN